jgi:predicted molibdopterin-dependent oxidoreductase YjgC
VLNDRVGIWSEIEMIEISQNNEGLVSEIAWVSPSFASVRIEKFYHQAIRIVRWGKLRFEDARPLKFSQTFQFVAGKSPQKIEHVVAIYGNYMAK